MQTCIPTTMYAKEIYQERALGFCFTAFRCTSELDLSQAFKSTMHEATFKTNFDTLSGALRNLELVYIRKCIERKKYILEDLANLVSNNEQEKIMTSIVQEFLKKGEQRGIQREKLHIAKNMLHFNVLKEKIHQFTGLSWVVLEAPIREMAQEEK